jgi:cephalosporin hydroxylase
MWNKISKKKQNNICKIYTLENVNEGHHNVQYRGVKAIRCPFDYVIYQMIIFEVKPDLIIEIGTHDGGSALYMADLLNNLGKGKIHTIDIIDRAPNIVKKHPRIELFNNGWENYDMTNTHGFETILIIEDGSHFYKDTIGVLRKFKDIVSKNSYFIVEDGVIDELGLKEKYDGGPTRAITEFLEENSEFRIEEKWCNFFGPNYTFNLDGYLKKY